MPGVYVKQIYFLVSEHMLEEQGSSEDFSKKKVMVGAISLPLP